MRICAVCSVVFFSVLLKTAYEMRISHWSSDVCSSDLPAALNRAWTLVNDARDNAGVRRLAAVAGDAGCHACHTQGSCTVRCPKVIAPTAAIAGLKRVT